MLENMESAISTSSVEFECEMCNSICKKENTLIKHMNTKHSVKSKIPVNIDESEEHIESNDNFREEELENWFQTEIIDNEVVYICNLCDEGFGNHDTVKKHMICVTQMN